jgi:Protein of unknown function (DUF732)
MSAARLVLVISLFGPLGAAASSVHADATDDAFTAALTSKGITFESPQAAIIAGHEVCDELDLGRTPLQVATDVTKNSNLGGYHAGYFIGLAIHTYCPKHAS